MKFTLSWLKDHLETDASLEAICDKLTAIGLEVESVEDRGKALAPFIVAEILTAEKHPNADKLQVCKVNTGKETLQVVCGAPNARAGLKAVLARPGDVIPETGAALKLSKIRNVESQGMMCAADELGLGGEHTGIIELPADAPVGESYARYAGLNDPVIEINLTPNRADCAGVYGVARDLAAAGLGRLVAPASMPAPMRAGKGAAMEGRATISSIKGKEPSRIKVLLDFPADQRNACPLFVGRLIRNIKNGPSPAWLQQRLRAIGLRPISALVDITNYLTFDHARPLHVFDADKIKGNLWVRPTKGGEKLEALDGKTYVLEAGMTAIGDDTGVLSLAGVIGGVSSSCDENTTAVFLESATFDPIRTARTGRALQINSDARYRFERGVDPQFVVSGSELAAQMIFDLCGTKETAVSEACVAGAVPDAKREIAYSPSLCLKRIGVDIPEAEQIRILQSLGFDVQKKREPWLVTPPSWRADVEGSADITEEIARIYGFEHIPSVSLPRPQAVTPMALDRLDQRASRARRVLASQGLMEAVTWSFMSSAIAEKFGAIDPSLRLCNPISADLDVMRPSVLGNLIMAAQRNANRGYADVGLFEVGPAYRDTTPEGQNFVAAGLRTGSTPRHWVERARAVNAFDAKADALAVLAACGVPVDSLQVSTDAPAWYHPGRSGCLRLGPTVLATFGEIHPALLADCDAEGPMAGCEVFLKALPEPRKTAAAKPLLKMETLQPVKRDFAFVVDASVTAAQMVKAVKGADKALVREVSVFDVFEGKGIDSGKKSVALSVTIQPDHVLTEAELESVADRVTSAVASATGATLRG